jgi:Phage integrase family/Arm DNA-binding domain/Phage integrase, N-terminal SAM-like domain
LPGFGTRIYPSGVQVYVVQYRERKHTLRREIGSCDAMDLRTARRKAGKILEEVKLGFGVVDPFAAKKEPAKLRFEEFIPIYLEHQKWLWAPRTYAKSVNLVERHLYPEFSSKILFLITRADVMRWRDGLAARQSNANRTIPILSGMMKLGDAARAVLVTLPRVQGSPFVFAQNTAPSRHITRLYEFWHKTVPPEARIKPLRLHDLRHSFASHAALIQENTPTIAKLLGHKGTDNTHRYMHLADRPVREAAEKVSALIARAMAGEVEV